MIFSTRAASRVPRIAPIEVPVPFQGTLVKHHNSPDTLSKTDNRRRAFGGELARGLQVNSPTKELRIRGNSLGLSVPAIPTLLK